MHCGVIQLEACLSDIDIWMTQNKLKLNANKTEGIIFGATKLLSRVNIPSIAVAVVEVPVSS